MGDIGEPRRRYEVLPAEPVAPQPAESPREPAEPPRRPAPADPER